ncbi:hypothetical protein SDC9_163687 [bioreactor metagenome]|uniref:Uncharacterized protein n=1 Tax=bioreactor metagenome TaxID=1076179 RepID=A0A645FPI8_9ZZZZ
MALAGAPRTKLNHVVVSLHKGDHSQQHRIFLPFIQLIRIDTNRPEQQGFPLVGSEVLPGCCQYLQGIQLGELDLPDSFYTERSASPFQGNSSII